MQRTRAYYWYKIVADYTTNSKPYTPKEYSRALVVVQFSKSAVRHVCLEMNPVHAFKNAIANGCNKCGYAIQ